MAHTSPEDLLKIADYQMGGGHNTGRTAGGGIVDLIAGVIEEKKKAKEKKVQDQMDMYSTLREAGYDAKAAFDAVQSGAFPTAPGGPTIKERNAEVSDRNSTRSKILKKVADGETLMPGEQKVYDEHMKKGGKTESAEDLLTSQGANKDNNDTSTYVAMTTPDGKRKKVHPDDVDGALKAGWKKR